MWKGYEIHIIREDQTTQGVFRVKKMRGKKPFTIPTNTIEQKGGHYILDFFKSMVGRRTGVEIKH